MKRFLAYIERKRLKKRQRDLEISRNKYKEKCKKLKTELTSSQKRNKELEKELKKNG